MKNKINEIADICQIEVAEWSVYKCRMWWEKTQEEMAELLSAPMRTYQRWENEQAPKHIKRMIQIITASEMIMESWFNEKN